MSDACDIPSDAVEQRAAAWLLRREEPGWNEADGHALDAWLEQSFTHKAAFWRLEHGWRAVGRLGALGSAALDLAADEPEARPLAVAEPAWRRPRQPLQAPRGWRFGAIAASIAAVAVIGLAVGLPSTGRHSFSTPVGGHETLPLADGSKVELSTNTRLVADVRRGSRNVWLDRGEAYFEVAHDPRHPFVVHAGPRTVTVLGTHFAVRRDGDRVRVVVAEGRVRVQPAHSAASVSGESREDIVTRGDTLVATAGSTLVARGSVNQVAGELSWRQGRLTFDQQTLGDAADEFNRYNTTRLVIADAAVAQMRIGGSFDSGNVEGFARLLQEAYGLRVERRDGEIEIGR